MKLAIISGSPRENSQSARVADYIQATAETACGFDTRAVRLVDIIRRDADYLSLAKNPELQEMAAWAEGFVFVTPEYAGMAPPALKQLFFKIEAQALTHKPAIAVGVSSGPGGTYPVTELRGLSAKNTRLLYVPENVIVRNVHDGFFQDDSQSAEVKARILLALQSLHIYMDRLAPVRDQLAALNSEQRFGM
jgi:NAD(P)H-dependent FMN reductase